MLWHWSNNCFKVHWYRGKDSHGRHMRWIDSLSESWSKLARIFIHMNLGWQNLYITHLPLYYNGTALFSPSSDRIFKILSVTVGPAATCLKVPKAVRKFCSLYLHWILKRTWLIQSRTTTKVSNTVAGNTWIILNLLNSIIQEYHQLVSVNKITGLLSPLSYHEWYASIMHEY